MCTDGVLDQFQGRILTEEGAKGGDLSVYTRTHPAECLPEKMLSVNSNAEIHNYLTAFSISYDRNERLKRTGVFGIAQKKNRLLPHFQIGMRAGNRYERFYTI